jgi:hypothetical protein
MTPSLESAMQDLDQMTMALLTGDTADMVWLCRAVERRSEAITRVASLLGHPAQGGKAVLDRLSQALRLGEKATQKALKMKQDAIEEWSRMNQIMRGLATGQSPVERQVDWSG